VAFPIGLVYSCSSSPTDSFNPHAATPNPRATRSLALKLVATSGSQYSSCHGCPAEYHAAWPPCFLCPTLRVCSRDCCLTFSFLLLSGSLPLALLALFLFFDTNNSFHLLRTFA